MKKSKKSNIDAEIAVRINDVSKYFAPSKGQTSIKQSITSAFSRSKEKKDEGYWALKNVSAEVRKGEFFGIVGRNGSGKSTLLKMIAGVYTPTSGSIMVEGRLIPFIELGVGFNPELSARDNVFLNGALLGFDRKEMHQMYDEIVSFAELEDHMDIKLKNFSSGMQVRLAFSIAIRAKADVLLIDEVLAVGDTNFQRKCYEVFNRLKEEKRTIIFVSHSMADIERFCDRVLVLKDGEKLAVCDPAEAKARYFQLNDKETSSQKTNKVVSRWGSGEIVAKHIDVLGADGQPTRTVNFGEDFGVRVTLENKQLKPKTKLVLGMNIFGEKSENVLGPNTIGGELNSNTRTTTVWFRNPNINAGLYTVSTAIFDPTFTQLMDHLDKSVAFRVNGSNNEYGLSVVKTEWKYE